jgi:hypothetical protein
MHMAALSHHFMRRSCTPCQAFWRKSQTSVVDVPWVAEPLWPASMPCLSHRKPSMRSSVDAMACTTTCLSAAQLASGMVHHAWSDPTASHCETGLVSRGLLGLLASWSSRSSRSRAGGPAAAEACAHLGRCLADGPARHGFCSLSLAEAKKPRQDALWCGWREATGAFLLERDTYGHTPPSHHSRPHRGPLPLAVGEGILPLEPEDVQVEAPQECSAHPPWACGRGA